MSIQRGEIYFVDLNPVQGREQAGQRPVLVLSIDSINKLPLVVTVVVGTRGEKVRVITLLMYVSRPRKADYLWRRYSCVFRFARLTLVGFQ